MGMPYSSGQGVPCLLGLSYTPGSSFHGKSSDQAELRTMIYNDRYVSHFCFWPLNPGRHSLTLLGAHVTLIIIWVKSVTMHECLAPSVWKREYGHDGYHWLKIASFLCLRPRVSALYLVSMVFSTQKIHLGLKGESVTELECVTKTTNPPMAVSSSPLPSPTHTPFVCDAAADRQWLLSAACVLWPFLRSGMLYWAPQLAHPSQSSLRICKVKVQPSLFLLLTLQVYSYWSASFLGQCV